MLSLRGGENDIRLGKRTRKGQSLFSSAGVWPGAFQAAAGGCGILLKVADL